MTAQKVKTKTVKRECPSYTKVCLHESKESNRGSEGDRREEIACSSEKTRVDPEKKIAKQTFLQCKSKCLCKGKRFAPLGLKQCPT